MKPCWNFRLRSSFPWRSTFHQYTLNIVDFVPCHVNLPGTSSCMVPIEQNLSQKSSNSRQLGPDENPKAPDFHIPSSYLCVKLPGCQELTTNSIQFANYVAENTWQQEWHHHFWEKTLSICPKKTLHCVRTFVPTLPPAAFQCPAWSSRTEVFQHQLKWWLMCIPPKMWEYVKPVGIWIVKSSNDAGFHPGFGLMMFHSDRVLTDFLIVTKWVSQLCLLVDKPIQL